LIHYACHVNNVYIGIYTYIQMWGAEWTLSTPEQTATANAALAAACRAGGVWPYFIPSGFMLTPVLDVDEASLCKHIHTLYHTMLYYIRGYGYIISDAGRAVVWRD
jgi:hypothetical protein